MDITDLRLLDALQADSSRSIAQLAAVLGMSQSSCHRRMRALDEGGYVIGYSAVVDPVRVGLTLQAFVEISLTSQSREAMDSFESAIDRFDDILECHLMAGAGDYLLRVVARDLAEFDRIHRDCLARLPGVSSMRSSFSIRTIRAMRGYRCARS